MGMYMECQDELVRALKAAGCEKEPFTSKKRLELSMESRISAVLCENDLIERASGKKFFTSADGARLKRIKLYDRSITYTVVIGDYDQTQAEQTYECFLDKLAAGIYVDGNYVSIEPTEAQWMGEKDHILHAKVAVQLQVTCHGGLYRDSDMGKIEGVNVEVGKGY